MTKLIQFDAARIAIEKACSVDEVKNIHDKAEALRAYLKQSGQSLIMQNQCAEIKLRAEHRGGELFKDIPREGGGQPKKNWVHDGPSSTELQIAQEESGIKQSTRKRWEAIASIPEDEFEAHIASVKDSEKELTEAGTLKISKKKKRRDAINQEKEQIVKANSEIEIRKGDFKSVLVDVREIDAIITDPPYPKEFLPCFSELSEYASEHLKEDGFLIVYSGQYHLPEVIRRLSEKMTYVWTFCLYHVGKKQLVNGINVMCGWKPVLIFSKGNKKMRFSAYDVLISEQREKDDHEWQQSQSGVAQLIEIFSKPGELVVDPFSGSGTFGKVAKKLGRNFIGAEIE